MWRQSGVVLDELLLLDNTSLIYSFNCPASSLGCAGHKTVCVEGCCLGPGAQC